MSDNIGSAIMMVGCLMVALLAIMYNVPYPYWVLWLVGIVAILHLTYPAFTKERKELFKLEIQEKELKIELLKREKELKLLELLEAEERLAKKPKR